MNVDPIGKSIYVEEQLILKQTLILLIFQVKTARVCDIVSFITQVALNSNIFFWWKWKLDQRKICQKFKNAF